MFDLLEFYWGGTDPAKQVVNVSEQVKGVRISGDPSGAVEGGQAHVFARGAGG